MSNSDSRKDLLHKTFPSIPFIPPVHHHSTPTTLSSTQPSIPHRPCSPQPFWLKGCVPMQPFWLKDFDVAPMAWGLGHARNGRIGCGLSCSCTPGHGTNCNGAAPNKALILIKLTCFQWPVAPLWTTAESPKTIEKPISNFHFWFDEPDLGRSDDI